MPEDDNELSKLKREVAQLKDQINPPPRPPSTQQPYDYTQGASMPASALKAMVDAMPDTLIRGLREDARKPSPVTVSRDEPQTQPVQRGTGWGNEVPISSPPGIELCDRMMDQQDRIDKAELALRLAKAGLGKGEI